MPNAVPGQRGVLGISSSPKWLGSTLVGTSDFCKGKNCQPQKYVLCKDLWAEQTVWGGGAGGGGGEEWLGLMVGS